MLDHPFGFNPDKEAPAIIESVSHDPGSGVVQESQQAPEEVAAYDLPDHVITIEKGDTLSAIFSRLYINQQNMYQVLEADSDILVLDTLQAGHVLKFWKQEDTAVLDRLKISFNSGEHVVFHRLDENTFGYERISIPGGWRNEIVAGEISNNLFASGRKAGLTIGEIDQIQRLFEPQLDFSRHLRAGDRFEVLRFVQSIEGVDTGVTRIKAIRFYNQGSELGAYLHEDGSYYDADGNSLARAFLRVPLKHNARISSRFNPKRRHPVTRRIAPHNGTDFVASIGTPVLAAGDGVVTRVENHPFAGRYLVIEHGSRYRTQYLHLDSVKVKRGQRVTRGQQIARSGNTGRTTGPHLHYELHINGRPVDPMRAKIPMASSIEPDEIPEFKRLVSQYNAQLDAPVHLSDADSNPKGQSPGV